MKVKDLINELNNLDKEMEIICYCEDNTVAIEKQQLSFSLKAVSPQNVQIIQNDKRQPLIKFQNDSHITRVALLEMVADE